MTDYGRRIFGFGPHEPITRRRILHALHPDDRQSAIFSIPTMAPPGELSDTEFRIESPGDDIRWIRSRARARPDSGGNVEHISGTFVDITNQKAAESEALQQRRELAHLMRVSMLGQLSGGIAHELTQPLAAILANAEAAKILFAGKKTDQHEIGEILDDIIGEGNRATEVIHQLRRMLKKGDVKLEPLDANGLVCSTLRLVHSELIGRRIRIDTELEKPLAAVAGNAVQLQQVILNLLMNAADAMNEISPSRRIIVISTRMVREREIQIRVTDRGAGVPPALKAKLFQPFFTTKEGGLGLGLSISSSLVEQHGGELHLENNPEGGTIAWFGLPIHEAAATI
jgi:C4-dicarboxylate-specific signal transduction histidine kinase